MSEVKPVLTEFVDHLIEAIEAAIPEVRRDRKLRAKIVKAAEEAYRQQFRTRYRYLVGKWGPRRETPRSKDTRTGKLAKNRDVIAFIEQGNCRCP
jgi:hypothetical protein